MITQQTRIPGVMLFKATRFGDARGWFSESWNAAKFAQAGFELDFVTRQLRWSCAGLAELWLATKQQQGVMG